MSALAFRSLQAILGYQFKEMALLTQALTHRSFSSTHNERLEFLGDSVLNLLIATLLLEIHPHLSEGDLSRIRAYWVKQDTLAGFAHELKLSQVLRLGQGEMQSGGKKRPSILADTFEALIGAIYVDGGFEAAYQVIATLYREKLQKENIHLLIDKDHKTALQEYLQAKKHEVPVYEVVATSGVAHRQEFEVKCTVASEIASPTVGKGASRRAAEQVAAGLMLQKINEKSQLKKRKKSES